MSRSQPGHGISMKQRHLLFSLCLLGLLQLVSGAVPWGAHAFAVAEQGLVGPGSEWVYKSNLGTARSSILSQRVQDSGEELYRWRLSVAGLTYEEDLLLTSSTLSVTSRFFNAFRIYSDAYDYPLGELTFRLPLTVGSKWEWDGPVLHGSKEGVTRITGQVVGLVPVTVPAATFLAYEIHLQRNDDFGATQDIKLWFHPEVGVVRATGTLHWRGLVGKVQRLIGFDLFEVELETYSIVRPSLATRDEPAPPDA